MKKDQKPKLIVSQEVSHKVNYLHSLMGKKEWSGVLIYSIEEGTIETPNSLVLKARDIYLMDIGSSAYTEYEFGQEAMKIYQQIPETDPFAAQDRGELPWKFGTIHTHHNMGAFFSPTDIADLKTNAPCHTFYLSLIVDWKCEYKAKIAVAAVIDEVKTVTWKNGVGSEVSMSVDNKKTDVFNVDCEISFDNVEDFSKRIEEIRKSDSSYMNKKRVPDFSASPARTRFVPPKNTAIVDDISPNQQSMFDDADMIPDHKIEDFIVQLVGSGSLSPEANLEEAFRKIDMNDEGMISMWMDSVMENIYEVFDYMFPNTRYVLEDVFEKCLEIIEPYASNFNSAGLMYNYISEMYIEFEDGSTV